jgi:hypothetical protein
MTSLLSGDCEGSDRIRPKNWVEFSLDAMTRFVPRLFVLFVAIAVSACSRTVKLELPSDMPVTLTTDRENPGSTIVELSEVTLPPNTPEHRRLQKWFVENQRGWSQAFAADPPGGIIVHAGKLHLHFFEGGVSTAVPDGIVQKTVRKEDYAYLKEVAAHLTNR